LETGPIKRTGKAFVWFVMINQLLVKDCDAVSFVKELDGEGALLYDKKKRFFISFTKSSHFFKFLGIF